MKTRLAAALALAVVLLPSATAAPERQAKYAVRDLGTLGGTVTAAADVNAMGQVVGFSMTSEGFLHAFVWDRGVMTDLGTLGGESSYATAINDSGWVVGFSQISHSRRCTHVAPIFKQSSQPFALGVTSRISTKCSQLSILVCEFILTTRGRLFNVVMERNEAFIRITPRPVFARLERRHDRVIRFVKMFRRVLVTRRIAASDMPAR